MTIAECLKRLQVMLDERAFPIQADENALLKAIEVLRLVNLPEPEFKVDAVVRMLSAMEESAEITQAASKVIRSITPGNPTPVSRLDAKYRLNIEIGDLLCVLLMADKLGLIDRRLIIGNCAGNYLQAYTKPDRNGDVFILLTDWFCKCIQEEGNCR